MTASAAIAASARLRRDRRHSRPPRLHPQRRREGLEQGDADLCFTREIETTGARAVREEPMTRYAGNAAGDRGAGARSRKFIATSMSTRKYSELEMEQLFPNSWVYVGHDSQVPNPGDYYGTMIGTQPILLGPPYRRQCSRALQPLPAQGHAHHVGDLRQHRQILPLPLSRLELQDRRLAARDAPEEGLREHRLRAERRRPRA